MRSEYRRYDEKYEDDFRVGMGAEAIKELLAEIDLDNDLSEELQGGAREALADRKRFAFIKRLEVVEAFRTVRQPPRMDDSRRRSGNSAGYPSYGTA